MSHTVNALTHRHPAGARLGLIVAHLYVPALAAITVVAAVTGHTWLAVLGVLTGLSGYPTGYLTAAHHYLKRLHREVAHARTDPLTGLPNRAVTDTILDQATPTGRPMTVALIDIDGLHIINGNFGHAAGDQYLTAVARRLAAATPASGVLVRQGGDEFTLLAPGYDPDRLADDIAAALTDPVLIAGHRIQPRVSVGIAATDQTGPVNGRRVRARADSALYSAKRRGGHQTCVFDADRDPEPSPDGTRPLLRRRDLNPATGTGLAWQPTVDDELVPLLLSFADIRAVHDALTTACDRWAQASTDADAHTGVRRPASPASSTPAPVNVEPTGPAGPDSPASPLTSRPTIGFSWSAWNPSSRRRTPSTTPATPRPTRRPWPASC
jgi:diguanylate cyclase (GGDEF)-like protein